MGDKSRASNIRLFGAGNVDSAIVLIRDIASEALIHGICSLNVLIWLAPDSRAADVEPVRIACADVCFRGRVLPQQREDSVPVWKRDLLSGARLWWLFHRKRWSDQFRDMRGRFYCTQCQIRYGKRVRPTYIGASDQPSQKELPMPDEREWKRALRRFRC